MERFFFSISDTICVLINSYHKIVLWDTYVRGNKLDNIFACRDRLSMVETFLSISQQLYVAYLDLELGFAKYSK